jgi:sugar phosphate isomerase/epimerase
MAKQLALGLITGIAAEPLDAFKTIQELGIPTIQLGYPGALDNDEGIEKIKAALAATGLEITAVFCGFAGERYDDIATVRATVGLVPEDTRAERVEKMKQISAFARKLDVKYVAAHIGFVPEVDEDPIYPAMVETVKGICDVLARREQNLTLETGQETARGLRRFIKDVDRTNLRVNFDPANMILYGNDNPIEALDLLIDRIDSVHCKDGKWPTEKGKLGHETPFGEGDVNVPEWIKKLLALGFTGPLTIEREISGEEQKRDILRAKDLLTGLIEKYRVA